MNQRLRSVIIRSLFPFIVLLLSYGKSYATHLFGADLFYTHISGSTYQVTLVAYGDCSGSSFPLLIGASPEVDVYNGTALTNTISLTVDFANSDIEVTPVCPAEINNTRCTNPSNPLPGVKKYTYRGTVNLPFASTNWRFRFDGSMGGHQAGRSAAITNITSGGSSLMALEATLNNTLGPNSSSIYTTIPTPFFCINKPVQYNQGAVDPNGDALTFALVDGLEPFGTVGYIAPYSATNPIQTSGGLAFSATTGQLSFTPNMQQNALVVTRVEEKRGSVVVGTSMREMVFVVLPTCNNNPPNGNISNNNGGTIVNGTSITVCQSQGLFTFSINPMDLDGDDINVTWSGLPAGATFAVINNNSTAPLGTFSWNVTGVAPGTYNFFVTYTDDGCPLSSKQTLAYSITILPRPGINFTLISPATCTKKAVFTVTPTGGPTPYIFTILQGSTVIHNFPGITGTQLDSLSPGTYTFRVTNANNCFRDTTIVIAGPPLITANILMTTPTCHGGNNGSITVNVLTGLSPFQYSLGTGPWQVSNTFNNLTAGTYTIHIKDANNCTKDTTVTLQDAQQIGANISVSRPTCNVFNNGAITITGNNGAPPYQYAMGTGPFGPGNVFSGLSSGFYLLRIKDANNCIRDTLYQLKDSIVVKVNAVVTHVLCYGQSNGSVTLNAFDGTAPYKYKMGTGPLGTNNVFNNLPAGTYTFHIEDVNQCYYDTTITITQPTPLTTQSVVTHVTCNGFGNGTITINGVGGTSPYVYAIGSGAFSATNFFNNLVPGTYTLHVRDANNCLKDTNITITEPAVLGINNLVIVRPSCFGFSDGTVTVNATGGTTPYTYAANGGAYQSSNVLTGLPAGTHIIRVKDANDCLKDTTITFGQPTQLGVTAQVKQSTCSSLHNGRVVLTPSGGTPPYTYAYNSNPYTSIPFISPLAAGTYTFYVKDSKNCIKDTIITIIDSLVLTANVTVTDAQCYNQASGAISVTGGGGVNPYTYALGTGTYGSNNNFTSLLAGGYLVRIKDDIGCMKDTNVTVAAPPAITASAVVSEPSCFGLSDGSVTINAGGGTSPYTFAIGSGAFGAGNTFNNLATGTYTFHIKDANNCTKDTTITLSQPTPLGIAVTKTDALCFGQNNGTVTVTGSGGTPAYAYAVDAGAPQASNVLNNLAPGTHIIHLIDANNCTKDTTLSISQPEPITFNSVAVVEPTCEGYKDGQVTLQGKGGTPGYTYAVDNGNFTSNNVIGGLAAGTYTLHIKDNNGCTYDTTLVLTGLPPIVIAEVTASGVRCYGETNGVITVTALGGVPPFTYRIDDQGFINNGAFAGLATGTYTVRVKDDAGCFKDTIVTVLTPALLELEVLATPNDCEGYDTDGKIQAVVSGGTKPYKYAWSTTPEQTGEFIAGMPNGTYGVKVLDSNECTVTDTGSIIYNDCCNVFVPDAFTPNGDGKNDKFHVLFKGDFQLKLLSVYNRFGQMVFTTTTLKDGWDGRTNGEPSDMGVYMYYIKGICGNGGTRQVEYKGDVTLIR